MEHSISSAKWKKYFDASLKFCVGIMKFGARFNLDVKHYLFSLKNMLVFIILLTILHCFTYI